VDLQLEHYNQAFKGSQTMRKKKRRSGCVAGIIVTLLFAAAAGYIVFIAWTQPERFTLNFNRQAAPAVVLVPEEPDEPESVPPEENIFSQFNFYIADKQPAYEAYRSENPTLSDEEIVWRVNAGLYRPFFSEPALITHANPLLINPYNKLPEYFTPQALEPIDNEGREATPETVRAFERMKNDAERDGFKLRVQSAYRSIEYQRELYNRAGGDGAVARPAYSEHHTGRALDLSGPDGLMDVNGPTEMGRWVRDNAYRYGFIVRYTEDTKHITGYIYEPWHITYVGETIAREMNEYKTLEEYVARNPTASLTLP
jgi:D-alanyl-D-alanine carboxypeptidase